MPYIISFSKPVLIADTDLYLSDCCIGGDVVLERLQPTLRDHYGHNLQADQEDWSWFTWFEELGNKFAVDIHTEDAERGEFKVHLTGSRTRFFFGPKIQDIPELRRLRDLIQLQLQSWQVDGLSTELVDKEYMPI